jgi:hypothetical protein
LKASGSLKQAEGRNKPGWQLCALKNLFPNRDIVHSGVLSGSCGGKIRPPVVS